MEKRHFCDGLMYYPRQSSRLVFSHCTPWCWWGPSLSVKHHEGLARELWNSHHVCFMSCTEKPKIHKNSPDSPSFWILHLKYKNICHLSLDRCWNIWRFWTWFFFTIQLVPNSFQLYRYDIQLLSLFSRKSLILGKGSIKKKGKSEKTTLLFWGLKKGKKWPKMA